MTHRPNARDAREASQPSTPRTTPGHRPAAGRRFERLLQRRRLRPVGNKLQGGAATGYAQPFLASDGAELPASVLSDILGLEERLYPKHGLAGARVHRLPVHQEHPFLDLTLDPGLGEGCAICQDVSNIGHFGTGDLRVKMTMAEDVPIAKRFIDLAYQRVSGLNAIDERGLPAAEV